MGPVVDIVPPSDRLLRHFSYHECNNIYLNKVKASECIRLNMKLCFIWKNIFSLKEFKWKKIICNHYLNIFGVKKCSTINRSTFFKENNTCKKLTIYFSRKIKRRITENKRKMHDAIYCGQWPSHLAYNAISFLKKPLILLTFISFVSKCSLLVLAPDFCV